MNMQQNPYFIVINGTMENIVFDSPDGIYLLNTPLSISESTFTNFSSAMFHSIQCTQLSNISLSSFSFGLRGLIIEDSYFSIT